ncbi:3-oxoacyl-ACP synthase [Longibacter salinarum]|uniref:Beta-ketoacyl-[acyl-carrier-protein] synthase III n=1 Tax=Longibacter salinarum TaxID=1850348 RepID=A0A2A8D0Q2_9BACT|nr:beta-ketoacyl-ACP synthase III [Longibacter salinarum]PEN14542.1 3-oxoacyl-ACP synthase [Longibacter salinarum]
MPYASITGWGHYAPDNVVTNDDLAQHMETSDEWIRSRSGIRERRFAEEGETTATMSIESGKRALERANLSPEELDLILVASSSPDYLTPPVSSQVQEGLGAKHVGAMQLTVGCTGWVYAMVTAEQFIRTGAYENILVVGTELTSRWLSWENRGTAVLFGDGSGAVVVQASDEPAGILGHVLGSDGSGAEDIILPGGGVAQPLTHERLDANEYNIKMNGREVFRFATRIMGTALEEALHRAERTVDDIDLFVPHQANARIIEYAAKDAGLPRDKVVVNVDRYGNTSAASVPIALSEAFDEGRAQPGDTIAVVAFGAGLTWASAIVQLSASFPALQEVAEHPAETRARTKVRM